MTPVTRAPGGHTPCVRPAAGTPRHPRGAVALSSAAHVSVLYGKNVDFVCRGDHLLRTLYGRMSVDVRHPRTDCSHTIRRKVKE